MTSRASHTAALLRVFAAFMIAALSSTLWLVPHTSAGTPRLTYTTVITGLSNPWDVTFVRGAMLYSLRAGEVWSERGNGPPTRVMIQGWRPTFARGEGGLLGIAAHPQADHNGYFYTCAAVAGGSGKPQDVRVERWRLTGDNSATAAGTTVAGLPLTSGRHSGCRMRFDPDGKLYIGTGDAAIGTAPQDLNSLGGKVLRVDADGSIPPDNPFYSRGGNARYVWSYGHRNVQGLDFRPGASELWNTEHGPGVDDEVNLIRRAGNFGWDPVPGYNESVPMTDQVKHRTALPARRSSGSPTIAVSGSSFLSGRQWGEWDGQLAVAALKGHRIMLLRIGNASRVVGTSTLPGSTGLGRIRTVQQGPDGALYVTTDNGGGRDRIIRITAR